MSMNSDGSTVSNIETDYWSEPASEVYVISKRNEMPEYPPMPEHDRSMADDADFDNFKFNVDTNLEVMASIPGELTIFNSSIGKTKNCLEKLNTAVIVSTWYGITYDSDFE